MEDSSQASCGDKFDDTTAAAKKKDIDPELEELLADALTDFDKPLAHPSNAPVIPPQTSSSSNPVTAASATTDVPQKKEELGEQEMIDQFENAVKAFFDENQAQMKSDFMKMVQSNASDDEFNASIQETLKNLAEKTQMLGEHPTDEDMNRLLNLDEPDHVTESEFYQLMPMMQSVVQNLLSKELLYPALRDIVEKYPDWLAEKQPTLPAEEYQRYSSQLTLMRQVCAEYESETPSDTEAAKKARFNKILLLMQKMQDCGQPPREIVGDSPSPLELNPDGFPKLVGDKCSVM